jgi:hypothetical protein
VEEAEVSADNWTVCPVCLVKNKKAKEDTKRELDALYGTIDVHKFRQREAAFHEISNSPKKKKANDCPLREDWEMGMQESGVLFISYYCSCHDCGFEYSHKQEIDTQKDNK